MPNILRRQCASVPVCAASSMRQARQTQQVQTCSGSKMTVYVRSWHLRNNIITTSTGHRRCRVRRRGFRRCCRCRCLNAKNSGVRIACMHVKIYDVCRYVANLFITVYDENYLNRRSKLKPTNKVNVQRKRSKCNLNEIQIKSQKKNKKNETR